VNGYTTVTFTRSMATGVPNMPKIDPDNAGVIWALARENALVNHYSSGMGIVNLATGTSEIVEVIVDYTAWVFPAAFLAVLLSAGLLVRHTSLGETFRGPLRRRVGKPVHGNSPPAHLMSFIMDLSVAQALGLVLFVVCLVLFPIVDSRLHGDSGIAWTRALGWLNTILFGLVTLPQSRTTLWLHVFGIPFERAVVFHTVVARLAFFSAVSHLVVAMVNYGSDIPLSANQTGTVIPFWGLLAFVTMAVMTVSAAPPIRRRFFEVFYYTHLTLIPLFYLFAVLHCNSILHRVVLLAPLSLYFIDRALRLSRRRLSAKLVLADPLTSGDQKGIHLRLQMASKPAGFEAGGYFFLNIPEIDVLAWHPFSVSSAPHDDGTINFHILSMGNGTFTDRLVDHFSQTGVLKNPPTFYVDGPLGSLSVDLAKGGYKTALMVAGGIGITPMTSVLEDMMLREASYPTLTRVVLVWVVRKPEQLAWLSDVIDMARTHSSARLKIELRLHYTQHSEGELGKQGAVHGRPDIQALLTSLMGGKSVPLDAKDIELQETDGLVGTSDAPTHRQIAVLACGPASLVASVQTAAHKQDVDFHKESFEL
jgi:NAD(P)H-flavin reductase